MKIGILRNSDGKVMEHRDNYFCRWIDLTREFGGADYMYTDGNYGCDCNRHLFFEQALGNDPQEHFPCGDRVAYTIVYALDDDGFRTELNV